MDQTKKIKAKLKPRPKPTWTWSQTSTGSAYYVTTTLSGAVKCAIFDLDDTLMTLHDIVPITPVVEYAKKCHREGCRIIVISNQYGITKGTTTHQAVQNRFKILSTLLGLQPGKDVTYIYAIAKDKYRKPMTGMFNEVCPEGAAPDSFYCGDAVGRSGDFAVSDYYFAKNCNLMCISAPDLTPVTDSRVSVKYQLYRDLGSLDKWVSDANINTKGPGPELVLTIGPQGCGKSTLAKLYRSSNYVILNRDTIGSTVKLQKMYNDCIHNMSRVFIDNTNYSKDTRDGFIKKAISAGYKVKIYYFDIPKMLSFHMCHMRVQLGGPRIPPVAIHTYYKRLEPPTADQDASVDVTVFNGILSHEGLPTEYQQYFNLKER